MTKDLRTLLAFIGDGRWYLPQDLLKALDIDADSLSQNLELLQECGVEIQQHRSKGMALAHPLVLLEHRQILRNLQPALRDSLVHVEIPLTADSTNTRAMDWLRRGKCGRALFLTEHQRNGRGRRGRTWISPMARNLTMSLVWPVANTAGALQGFSRVVALSVVDGLRSANLAGIETLRVKWPNDVWLGDAKLAGILLELHGGQGGPHHVVIGLGINVHLPEQSRAGIDQPVCDLFSRDNRKVDRNLLAAKVLDSVASNLESLESGGFESFRQRWQNLDVFQGRQVEVTGHGQQAVGVVSGVNSAGALILRTQQGERCISSGEIAPSLKPFRRPGIGAEPAS